MPFKDIFCVPTPTPSCGSPACRCINSPVWVICREREFSTDTQVAIDKHDSGCVTLCSLVKSALEEEESAQPQQKRPVQLGCCTKRIVHSG
ncbi:uncharacterized protein [Dipodomys merriami]|uniref:uncharacterized protein isoform X8 n=1 Tax=Dipodomys merriami TaxID=94247 RepID=UPI0038558B35